MPYFPTLSAKNPSRWGIFLSLPSTQKELPPLFRWEFNAGYDTAQKGEETLLLGGSPESISTFQRYVVPVHSFGWSNFWLAKAFGVSGGDMNSFQFPLFFFHSVDIFTE